MLTETKFVLPSLFQRTETRPLLGFGVKAFDRVKKLPIGAPTDGIDLLVHGSIAANLKQKSGKAVEITTCIERFTVED